MRQSLRRRCDDTVLVEHILDELQANGWLCEARLAEQWIGTRRRRFGASRIRQELARRGIDAEVISQASVGLETTDLSAALALWQRRFGTPAADRNGRERQLRFLVSRGFSHALALKVLRMAQSAQSFDPDLASGELQ